MSVNRLTKHEIVSTGDPYIFVTDYANEFRISNGAEAVPFLPSRLQQALLILDLDSEYHNGGLGQYFDNRTDKQNRVSDAVELVPSALDAMSAIKLAEITRQATACWLKLVEEPDSLAPAGKVLDTWFERMLQAMCGFDDQFELAYDESVTAISAFIRNHADEFCHNSW